MNFNIHDVVRGAIQTVNTDVAGVVYVSSGRSNVRGILTPTYTQVSAQIQVQAADHRSITHERGLEYTQALFTIYAYGNFNDIERASGSGGDVVTFGGHWYYISTVREWWPQWCCFDVTKQLDATNLTAFLAALKNGANP